MHAPPAQSDAVAQNFRQTPCPLTVADPSQSAPAAQESAVCVYVHGAPTASLPAGTMHVGKPAAPLRWQTYPDPGRQSCATGLQPLEQRFSQVYPPASHARVSVRPSTQVQLPDALAGGSLQVRVDGPLTVGTHA